MKMETFSLGKEMKHRIELTKKLNMLNYGDYFRVWQQVVEEWTYYSDKIGLWPRGYSRIMSRYS